MTAHTPGLAAEAGLAPLASRYVDPAQLPWEATPYAGVEMKVLLRDESSGLLTALFRWAPGSELPFHEHVEIEQTYVLEGRLVDKEGPDAGGECGPGDFVWRPAGSRHVAWTPEGGLMIAIFQVPNRFFEADGRVVDMLDQDWAAAWQGALDG